MELTHVNSSGSAFMVDVSSKDVVRRTASAYGKIILQKETINLVKSNLLKKGDVLAVAKIAGIMAGKKTEELIPLCHCLNLEHLDINFNILDDGIEIISQVVTTGKTGVEMEALTAVSVAALTIYDMCKAVDKTMRIENIYLIEKRKRGSPEYKNI
jgi:cyclic pyranopterin phosphate synthase